ncbi:MAG: hypothetical protein L0229_12925 [Blastocatellia bacterium]|nr:hypothetical protein [Blastocatellia bacterium]
MDEEISPKMQEYLEKVERELARYEHPLFDWQAYTAEPGIEVCVFLKYSGIHDDPYRFQITPRELEAQAFEWDFQRQLYNYLHDYLVEMFTRSPHIRE